MKSQHVTLQGLDKWYRSMAYGRANIVLYYDTGGEGNIFTKENMQQIEIIEDKMFQMHNYTSYCVQSSALECQKFTSILRYFDGTYANIDPLFYDPEYNNISQVLYAARTNNQTKGDFAYFLAENHRVDNSHAYAPVTRTIVPLGYPLSLNQKLEAMEEDMESFLVKNFKPAVQEIKDRHYKFKVVYWSYLLFRHDIVIQIFYDLMLAVGSILFIFGFIVYHTKSMWISTFAVSSILTSFLCTNIIYRVVLDFRYFGFFHVITLFIILGIGADDLFVFLDVWKNTGYHKYESLAHRLSCAYKKSVKSMFFTSLTTTAAFLASAFSPLLATKSFGVYAGLLVVVNYLSVVVYFPTVVIIHHLYFKNCKWTCLSFIPRINLPSVVRRFRKKQEKTDLKPQIEVVPNNEKLFEDNSAIGSQGNKYNVVGKLNPTFKSEEDEYGFLPFTVPPGNDTNETIETTETTEINEVNGTNGINTCDINTTSNSTTATIDTFSVASVTSGETSNISSSVAIHATKKKKALVRFFRDYYFYVVTHWIAKWIIIILLSVNVIFFAICISRLETDNEQVMSVSLSFSFHDFITVLSVSVTRV
mgnify:CR=1 FL=1